MTPQGRSSDRYGRLQPASGIRLVVEGIPAFEALFGNTGRP